MNHYHRKSGFTLVEILVVLSIVAVLVGITLPVFARMREQGRQTVCTSNLRQTALAVRMYMDDYSDRPLRMQSVWDSGHIRVADVLLCPDDESANRGGLHYEAHVREPSLPPETVRYSYHNPFTVERWGIRWEDLMNSENGNPGVAVCQLHGSHSSPLGPSSLPPSLADMEGTTLRARLDGSIARRQIVWERVNGDPLHRRAMALAPFLRRVPSRLHRRITGTSPDNWHIEGQL